MGGWTGLVLVQKHPTRARTHFFHSKQAASLTCLLRQFKVVLELGKDWRRELLTHPWQGYIRNKEQI